MALKNLLRAAVVALTLTSQFASVTSYAKINIPDNLKKHYELSAECVKDSFEKEGWDLEYVSANELNNLYATGYYAEEGYDIAGVTVYDLKTIYLSNKEGYAENSLNHELGHYLDFGYYTYYGIQPSQTEEFNEIFKKEAAASPLFSAYEIDDTLEYFAQSYRQYSENKEDLALFYPETYKYIDKIVDGYAAAIENNFTHKYDDSVFMMNVSKTNK